MKNRMIGLDFFMNSHGIVDIVAPYDDIGG